MLTEQVIQRVRAFRIDKKWSVNKFAVQAGVSEATLRKIDDADWNPEIKTLRKLEAVVAREQDAA